MIRKIIYTMPDGRLAVCTPVRNTRGDEHLTDDQIEQRMWAKLPASAINPQFVDPAEIPADRSQRQRWRQNGGRVRLA